MRKDTFDLSPLESTKNRDLESCEDLEDMTLDTWARFERMHLLA
jgi:hypothetical protein